MGQVQRLPAKAGVTLRQGMGWVGYHHPQPHSQLEHWSNVAGQTVAQLLSLVATMDPPQTTLCHRPSLLIVHPGVRIIGQHCAAIMPQDQPGTNYWRRTLYQLGRLCSGINPQPII